MRDPSIIDGIICNIKATAYNLTENNCSYGSDDLIVIGQWLRIAANIVEGEVNRRETFDVRRSAS